MVCRIVAEDCRAIAAAAGRSGKIGHNLMQFTDSALFERRLIDIMNPMPMPVRLDPAFEGAPSLNMLSSSLTKDGISC